MARLLSSSYSSFQSAETAATLLRESAAAVWPPSVPASGPTSSEMGLGAIPLGAVSRGRRRLAATFAEPDTIRAVVLGACFGGGTLLFIAGYILWTFYYVPRRDRLRARLRVAQADEGGTATGRQPLPGRGSAALDPERRRRLSFRLAREVQARNSTRLSPANLALLDKACRTSDPGGAAPPDWDGSDAPSEEEGDSPQQSAWGRERRASAELPAATRPRGLASAEKALRQERGASDSGAPRGTRPGGGRAGRPQYEFDMST